MRILCLHFCALIMSFPAIAFESPAVAGVLLVREGGLEQSFEAVPDTLSELKGAGLRSGEGYPFSTEVVAVMLVTDPSDLERTANLVRAASAWGPVRVLNLSERDGDPCAWGMEVNERFGSTLTCIDDEESTLIFGHTRNEGERIDMPLPLLPRRRDFCCITLERNSPQFMNILAGRASDPPLFPVRFSALLRDHRRALESVDGGDRTRIESEYAALLRDAGARSPRAGWIALNHADFCRGTADPQKAKRLFALADSLFVLNADTTGLILTAVHRARNAVSLSDWPDAETCYLSALHYCSALNDHSSEARILVDLAMTYELAGAVDKAQKAYELASSRIAANGDPYSAAQIYDHLGQMLRDNGRLVEAEEVLQAYMAKSEEMRSEPATARAHLALGTVALAGGRTAEAMKRFSAAADLMEMLGDSLGLARVDHNLGILYLSSGDPARAEKHYRSAIRRFERLGDERSALLSLRNLGEMKAGAGSWAEAHEAYDRALTLAQHTGEEDRAASLIYLKGLAHLKEGRLQTGYEEVAQAIELSNGAVHGSAQESRAFLRRLEEIIDEIQTLNPK